MFIFNMNYIIYEFTNRLNSYVISLTKNPYVILYLMLFFSIDYITYEFAYGLNLYVISWIQIRM